MNSFAAKPTLIFFQYRYDDLLPKFIRAHAREHVKCLSQFFNVVVVDHDCDYQQVCDTHQPDLALFERGVPYEASLRLSSCHRPKITNPLAHPNIPKIGFLHSDAFCGGRAGFLSDMDHLGIETYFSIATRAAENTPAISNSLFIWPNFVDPEVYHDYGLWKSIPVLFTGNKSALYPWRQRMVKLISAHYPSLICAHPGYDHQKAQQQIRVGESYARMLNSSLFVPACGTLAKEVVRKHFEVPACNACLVAEPSQTLDAAGFVDMINCVFAEEHDVLDKLSFLFKNPDALDKIVKAGFELVHRCHTIKQRDQVLQWYELNKVLKPHQKIVQTGPFEPLRIADRSSSHPTLSVEGLHLHLLRQGDLLLWRHDYAGAERFYLRCAQHIPWMPEAKLRLALCKLYEGNPQSALSWISEPIQFTLAEYGAVDPDPVEWAYFIVATICSGKLNDAIKRANQFPWLRHPELDRTRQAVMFLVDQRITLPAADNQWQRRRHSIHQLPHRSDREWFATLRDMLRACNRRHLAERLSNHLDHACADEHFNLGNDLIRQESRDDGKVCPHDTALLRTRRATMYFRRRLRNSKILTGLKPVVKHVLYSVEAKFGYFLPHQLSSSRNDDFYQTIYDLARHQKEGTALVVGADCRKRSTQAIIAGFSEREPQSVVICLKERNAPLRSRVSNDRFVKWYGPLSLRDQLQSIVAMMKEENNGVGFDTVLVTCADSIHEAGADETLYDVLRGAKYVLLENVNCSHIHEIYRRLRNEERHFITDENPNLRNGYAVFERHHLADGNSYVRAIADSMGVLCASPKKVP
jgi:hypothetical protein